MRGNPLTLHLCVTNPSVVLVELLWEISHILFSSCVFLLQSWSVLSLRIGLDPFLLLSLTLSWSRSSLCLLAAHQIRELNMLDIQHKSCLHAHIHMGVELGIVNWLLFSEWILRFSNWTKSLCRTFTSLLTSPLRFPPSFRGFLWLLISVDLCPPLQRQRLYRAREVKGYSLYIHRGMQCCSPPQPPPLG